MVQMDAVGACHVVSVAGIDEEVGVGVGIDAGAHEGEGVLGHADGVVAAVDDEEAPFEVLGFVEQGGAAVAFGVALRGVHVAFTVHDLVEAPVDDGTACHTDFEDVGVGGHEAGGHEAAEAPAVYAEACTVNVGEALEVFDAAELVFHLFDAKLAEGGLLEGEAAMFAAAVVEAEHDVALLCHPDVPSACAPVAAGVYVVGMWPAIDIDDGWILLGGVEVGGEDETVVQVGHAVSSLEGAGLDFWHLEGIPWVGGGEVAEGCRLGAAGWNDVDAAGDVGR